jgi:two-component system chemotaxis response regulator CheY
VAAKALILEADPETREMMTLTLELRGYEVITVGTSAEAVAPARAEQPALIIVDTSTSRLGGLELIRQLRSLPECGGRPVLATATYSAGALDRATKAGATRALLTPIDSDIFLAMAQGLLGQDW